MRILHWFSNTHLAGPAKVDEGDDEDEEEDRTGEGVRILQVKASDVSNWNTGVIQNSKVISFETQKFKKTRALRTFAKVRFGWNCPLLPPPYYRIRC